MTNFEEFYPLKLSSVLIICICLFYFACLCYLACYQTDYVEYYDEEDEIESNEFQTGLEHTYQTFNQPRLYRNDTKSPPPKYSPPKNYSASHAFEY